MGGGERERIIARSEWAKTGANFTQAADQFCLSAMLGIRFPSFSSSPPPLSLSLSLRLFRLLLDSSLFLCVHCIGVRTQTYVCVFVCPGMLVCVCVCACVCACSCSCLVFVYKCPVMYLYVRVSLRLTVCVLGGGGGMCIVCAEPIDRT